MWRHVWPHATTLVFIMSSVWVERAPQKKNHFARLCKCIDQLLMWKCEIKISIPLKCMYFKQQQQQSSISLSLMSAC